MRTEPARQSTSARFSQRLPGDARQVLAMRYMEDTRCRGWASHQFSNGAAAVGGHPDCPGSAARENLVSYHGVLAPGHALRSGVIPKTPTKSLGLLRKEPRAKRGRWVPWAELCVLRQTCAACSGDSACHVRGARVASALWGTGCQRRGPWAIARCCRSLMLAACWPQVGTQRCVRLRPTPPGKRDDSGGGWRPARSHAAARPCPGSDFAPRRGGLRAKPPT